MLIHDQEEYERRFPRAAAFRTAADIRSQVFTLSIRKVRSATDERHFRSLMCAPAAREPWFIRLLEKNNVDVEALFADVDNER